jgi:membrane-associated phospholipid phosphatase
VSSPRPLVRRPAFLGGVAAALGLVVLTALVVAHDGRPFGWDVAVHSWLRDHRTAGLTTGARVLTATGTGVPAYGLAAVAGLLRGGFRPWWQRAVAAMAVLAAVQLLRLGLATLVGRPRPPASDWASAAGGFAFPSGHTTSSALVAVLLVVALLRRPSGRSPAGGVLAVLWAAGVGVTRVYLGVHWPSDVLAGWLLVLALALPLVALTVGPQQGPLTSPTDPKELPCG